MSTMNIPNLHHIDFLTPTDVDKRVVLINYGTLAFFKWKIRDN